jgi:phytoene synthase
VEVVAGPTVRARENVLVDDVDGAPLARSYRLCRRIHREHGRSYYRAAMVLPGPQRRAVHALYAFTRSADDIVDAPAADPAGRAARLQAWGDALRSALAGAPARDPLLPAVVQTVRDYDLDPADLDLFLQSMAADLTVTRYARYADLLDYMEGSSAVIGTLMLPILGLVSGASEADEKVAREAARQLGFGFQLTNFVRDVAEDLARGRIYLPAEDLARFGVSESVLQTGVQRRGSSPAVRALIRYECARARGHYEAALPGLPLLEPRSRVCVRAAFLLYGAILEEVARAGYDVLRGRVVVPVRRRAALVGLALSERGFASQLRRWDFTAPA